MDMFKIVLLDDERLILQSLKEIIPWEKIGCVCVGEAEDGNKGIELIEKYCPDIVISDIVMPGKTGLEIAEYCRNKVGCKTIIISAYSDFSYAQKAMKYGVRHYVLKPISTENLLKAIEECINDIEKEREVKDAHGKLPQDVQKLAVSSLLFRIACYGHSLSETERDLILNLTDFRQGVIAAVKFLDIRVSSQSAKNLLAEGAYEVKRCLEQYGFSTNWGNSDTMLIFLCFIPDLQKREETRQELLEVLNTCLAGLDERYGMPIATVSDCFRDLSDVHERYEQCQKWLEKAFFCKKRGVIARETVSSICIYEPDKERLLHYVRHGNTTEMKGEFEKWKRWISHLNTRQEAMNAFRELYRNATISATQIGMSEKPSVETGGILPQFESCQTIIGRMENYLSKICEYAESNQSIVGKIKTIVEREYVNEDFSLTTIADQLDMNASYISRPFKEKFQENFSNYVLRRRIDQAKLLLTTTGVKNQEIASQCGFSDSHYFERVFKRETGFSLKQYREQFYKNK